MNDSTFGNDLHLARLEPDFRRLCAVLGWTIRSTDHWAPWARLRDKHGWNRMIQAAERCEPGKRFPSDVERQCLQLERDEKDAMRELQQAETRKLQAQPKTKSRLVKVGDRWEVLPTGETP